ncbi:MAG: hypothetical protein GF334_07160 [Candidatus Altiarchaeales archaeon]|nr:hypothetical protein [Candidatus Altiarchaeales archaeon]
MKLVSDYLRHMVAFMIERDDSPTKEDKEQRTDINQNPISKKPAPTKATGRSVSPLKKTKGGDVVETGVQKPTAAPKVKPPRRISENSKKWGEGKKTDEMRDYMREYRQTGQDKETGNPKSTYVKKQKT